MDSTYSGAPDECSIHWPTKLPCPKCDEMRPRNQSCRKCGTLVAWDGIGSWVDETDGDCCPEDNEVHEVETSKS